MFFFYQLHANNKVTNIVMSIFPKIKLLFYSDIIQLIISNLQNGVGKIRMFVILIEKKYQDTQ